MAQHQRTAAPHRLAPAAPPRTPVPPGPGRWPPAGFRDRCRQQQEGRQETGGCLHSLLCVKAEQRFLTPLIPAVPYDNNLAERMIRPAVILRRSCQSNRSEKGAAVQAVLMSVYRTLKLWP